MLSFWPRNTSANIYLYRDLPLKTSTTVPCVCVIRLPLEIYCCSTRKKGAVVLEQENVVVDALLWTLLKPHNSHQLWKPPCIHLSRSCPAEEGSSCLNFDSKVVLCTPFIIRYGHNFFKCKRRQDGPRPLTWAWSFRWVYRQTACQFSDLIYSQ